MPSSSSSSSQSHLLPPFDAAVLPSSLAMASPPDLPNAVNSYYMMMRELFCRLVVSLRIEPSLSTKIIAFWLWLQGNGIADLLRCIDSFDDYHVLVIACCAKEFVEALHVELADAGDRSVPRSEFQREAIEGISFYLHKVCYKVLHDLREKVLMREFQGLNNHYQEPLDDRRHPSNASCIASNPSMEQKHLLNRIRAMYGNTERHQGEGATSSSRNPLQVQRRSRIIIEDVEEDIYGYHQPTNSLAKLLENLSIRGRHDDPVITQQHSDVPRDERTLFVTFSNGYPLTKDDLHDFFMRHYGDIEEITIEEPIEDRPPLYAHVAFFSQLTLFRVLNGNKRVKFMANGKHLWARQFVPKKKKLRPDELRIQTS